MVKSERKITNAELGILSLVAEQPLHGYQIEQLIEERGMRDWTDIGFSSIYYILKKMEKQGWLKSHLKSIPQQGPARRVYTLTATGTLIWQKAALQALSDPIRPTSHFQLGLANLPLITKSLALKALDHYQTALFEREKIILSKKESYGKAIPNHVNAMFELSLAQIQIEREWLQDFIQKYQK
jgi:DNA-binding PadR family transcriptional regulator